MAKRASKRSPNNHSQPRVVQELLDAPENEASPWRILRIMSEFVAGFDFLRKYKKAATIFGSAREGFDKKLYTEATKLSRLLSQEGFAIITGGGPGFMEAANKGAHEAGGASAGICIKLPSEQETNSYVIESESFKYFFVRKTMLAYASKVYIFFPGGYGTLDEFFEILTLVQTNKIKSVPVIMIDKEYWQPLIDWMHEHMYRRNKAIDARDREMYSLVDNADEAFALVKQYVKQGFIK